MLLFVIIILLIYLFIGKKCFNIFNNIDTFYNSNNEQKCCLIKKVYDTKDNNKLFKYVYKKLYNDDCNYDLYNQNSNQQLFIEGDNNWDNNLCTEQNTQIGSCRNNNKECVNFLQKKDCNKYNMEWYNKSCHNAIPFVFSDKITRPTPIYKITNQHNKDSVGLNDIFKVDKKQVKNINKTYDLSNKNTVSIMY